jgi:uncharacterized membrane protein
MSATTRERAVALDAARGASVLAMVAFHFTWDLGNFGYIDRDLPYSAGVKALGHAIAISFLFIVGVSLALASAENAWRRRFWRRLALVTGAAGLVSLGTYIVFPQAFVFFGILHCIALSSLLAAPFVLLPWPVAGLAAILASLAPLFFSAPLFNAPWLIWTGLATVEPVTNDWQPLLPWSGAVLAGVAAALFWRARGLPPLGARRKAGPLAWMGRHSLAIYLLHQPALFAAFSALVALGAAPADRGMEEFVAACRTQCEDGGAEPALCQSVCRCTAERAQGETMPALAKAQERAERMNEIARACLAGER